MKKIATFILTGALLLGIGNYTMPYVSAQPLVNEISPNLSSRMGIPSTTLTSGESVNFIDNDGQAFYVPAGATVKFNVNLKTSGTLELGYVKSNGTKVKTYSGTAKSHTTNFTIASTGYYKFYITNKSSATVTVTGGSLTF